MQAKLIIIQNLHYDAKKEFVASLVSPNFLPLLYITNAAEIIYLGEVLEWFHEQFIPKEKYINIVSHLV